MSKTYQTPDWEAYRMDVRQPHESLEPIEREIAVVDGALRALVDAGILPHAEYDHGKFLAHRQAVRDLFEIPWTAITPRMQRLIWAVNAIKRPNNMLAAGVYCGNTFISNAGAAVGPGAVYTAENLIGVEIKPEEAERAERNVRRIEGGRSTTPSPTSSSCCGWSCTPSPARIVAADAVEVVRDFGGQIDLLYLDADGAGGRGKGVYLDILEACIDRMPPGSIVLAHNSVNCYERLQFYLDFVRDPANMSASVNVIFDPEGLEISVR